MRHVARFVPNEANVRDLCIEGIVSFCEIQSVEELIQGIIIKDTRTVLRLSSEDYQRVLNPQFIIEHQGLYIPKGAYAYVHVHNKSGFVMEDQNFLLVEGLQIASGSYKTQINFRYIDNSKGSFSEDER